MSDTTVSQIHSPIEDALTAALKRGAEELLAKAVEAEVVRLLEGYEQLRVDKNKETDLFYTYPPKTTPANTTAPSEAVLRANPMAYTCPYF